MGFSKVIPIGTKIAINKVVHKCWPKWIVFVAGGREFIIS